MIKYLLLQKMPNMNHNFLGLLLQIPYLLLSNQYLHLYLAFFVLLSLRDFIFYSMIKIYVQIINLYILWIYLYPFYMFGKDQHCVFILFISFFKILFFYNFIMQNYKYSYHKFVSIVQKDHHFCFMLKIIECRWLWIWGEVQDYSYSFGYFNKFIE